MKKSTSSASSSAKSGRTTSAGFGNAALDLIIKHAYRRHSRGRDRARRDGLVPGHLIGTPVPRFPSRRASLNVAP